MLNLRLMPATNATFVDQILKVSSLLPPLHHQMQIKNGFNQQLVHYRRTFRLGLVRLVS